MPIVCVLGKGKHELDFKRYVICTKHAAAGSRKHSEDLPTIKFTPLENPSSLKSVESSTGTVLQHFVRIRGEEMVS